MFGEGDLDLVLINGFTSHLELVWEHEKPAARFLDGLGSFARVINFDRRGSGLSIRSPTRRRSRSGMDDVRAVMDAAGSERAALLGISEGVSMGILFAATYPDRVQALVCSGGMARSTQTDDYPFGSAPVDALVESGTELIAPHWGEGALVDVVSPSQSGNADVRAFDARMERASASPGMLAALVRMFLDIDVRDVVPSVHVPVLIIHRTRDRLVNVRNGRWLAEHLPDARLLELDGEDHVLWYENRDAILGEIEEFLTGARGRPEPERTLATVLFTDIVDSTRTASELGDNAGARCSSHHAHARRDLTPRRARGQVHRRRLPRDVRRPRARDPLRRARSSRRRARATCACAPGSTPASARSWGTTSVASPSTSPRA